MKAFAAACAALLLGACGVVQVRTTGTSAGSMGPPTLGGPPPDGFFTSPEAERQARAGKGLQAGDQLPLPLTPAVHVGPALAKPIVVPVHVPAHPLRRVKLSEPPTCRIEPDLVFEVERPVDNLVVETRSPKEYSAYLVGPIKAGAPQKYPVGGAGTNAARQNARLEPGTYVVKLCDFTGAEYDATIALYYWTTPMNPGSLAKVPSEVPIAERNAYYYFPEAPHGHLKDRDTVRAAVYEAAPRQLFVFPKFDLDEKSAKAFHGGKTVEGPRKDEPLLKVDKDFYVSADAELFRISADYIVARPLGPPQVPARVRNNELEIDDAINSAGPEDQAAVAAFTRGRQSFEECKKRIWEDPFRQLSSLREGPDSAYARDRIHQIESQTAARVGSECASTKLGRSEDVLQRELERTRLARRTAALARARAHIGKVLAD